jgi:hypothetical protein
MMSLTVHSKNIPISLVAAPEIFGAVVYGLRGLCQRKVLELT